MPFKQEFPAAAQQGRTVKGNTKREFYSERHNLRTYPLELSNPDTLK